MSPTAEKEILHMQSPVSVMMLVLFGSALDTLPVYFLPSLIQ